MNLRGYFSWAQPVPENASEIKKFCEASVHYQKMKEYAAKTTLNERYMEGMQKIEKAASFSEIVAIASDLANLEDNLMVNLGFYPLFSKDSAAKWQIHFKYFLDLFIKQVNEIDNVKNIFSQKDVVDDRSVRNTLTK